MEYASIERELRIAASPEVVFDVITSPEHIRDWWSAETDVEAVAGSTGAVTWRDEDAGTAKVVALTVVEAQRPRRFSFRWTQPAGAAAEPANSLLVTFDLEPSGDGTVLRFTETGFREQGWELARLGQAYREHATGWDRFLPRIAECAARAAVVR